MDAHLRETDTPEEAPLPELPEVLPEPDGEPSGRGQVVAAPLSLHHLLDRAKPSLAEAASLAALVLDAVADMHDAGDTHGRLDSRSVRLGPGHAVRLAGRERGQTGPGGAGEDRRRADIRAAAAIMAEIGQAAGRPARVLTDREERVAARLAAAAEPRSLARRGPRRAARGLELALGRRDQQETARHGVTGLVRAVAGLDHPVAGRSSGGSGSGGGTPPGRKLPPPARRPPVWPRIWKPLAIATVVLLVIGVEVHLFGDAVKRNLDTLLSGDAEAAPAPNRPAPLPDLGPPAAGPITLVELRPLDRCRPETVCHAVVQVAVQPPAAALDIAWNFELVDRCGSRRESRPGGVLSVQPGHDRAVQTVAVPLPAGQALALVPVTTSPARTAGTPMLLSPADRPC